MKDIKGVDVFPGDKCLMSTTNGLILVTYQKDTIKSFVFNDSIKLPKWKKGNYMGYGWTHPDGSEWEYRKHGAIDYNTAKQYFKGDNNTMYKLTDISSVNQNKILKVEDSFTL